MKNNIHPKFIEKIPNLKDIPGLYSIICKLNCLECLDTKKK